MSFFTTAVTGLKTVVTAIGAGVGVWGSYQSSGGLW